MLNFILAPVALNDLDEIHAYIAEDNLEAADRVQDAAFATFELLARNPELGRMRKFNQASLQALRSWPVEGFRNYLIFYRPAQQGVEIVRVIHGARDLGAFLAND